MAELIQYVNGVPGIKWPVDKLVLHIGRSSELNDIWLDDAFVSKQHAQILVKRNPKQHDLLEYFIYDLQSTNHTYLNQELVENNQLQHNDILMLGKNKFVFLCEGVQEHVTPDVFVDDESETKQIVSEFVETPVEESSNDITVISTSSISGKHRFSRRLNIY